MFSKIKNIKIFANYSLRQLSTFRIGGNANYYIECYTIKSLKQVILLCLNNNIKYKIIGNGSNLLFDDKGYNGVIIKFLHNYCKIKNNVVITSSGTYLSTLIDVTKKHSLSGLETFVGIPCCVGGAIKNNLGSFGNEISNNLYKIKYLTINKKINYNYINKKINKINDLNNKLLKIFTNTKNKYFFSIKIKNKYINETDFIYRKCNFLKANEIIYLIYFKFNKLNKNVIVENIKKYYSQKDKTQPLDKLNAGSIFKRIGDIIPAKLIDDLGLKGTKIGDAEISTKHSGFIINNGSATSQNVLDLISYIKEQVKAHYNVDLETEVEFVKF